MKTLFFLFISAIVFGQNNTIESRFMPPSGYQRHTEKSNSFGYFLRNLPLKPAGTAVKYFDGSLKTKPNVYDAVVNLPIGSRDLHQCADAVIE